MNQSILNRSRLDKFTLILDIPVALKRRIDSVSKQNYKPDKIEFTVFGSPVPKIEIKHIALPFSGQHMNVSSHSRTNYEPLNLKFFIDNEYQNYWTLWNWLNLFNENLNSTSEVLTPVHPIYDPHFLTLNEVSDYVADFSLFALDEYNTKTVEFKYSGCFITSLSEIGFSHQDENLIGCSATFAYNQLMVKLLDKTGGI